MQPSYHISDDARERALLNYAIQSGMSIDVGRVIEESILSMASEHRRADGFGHPSLIYELCLRAGVVAGSIEEIQHPKSPISHTMIHRISRNMSLEADEPGPSTSQAAQPSHRSGSSIWKGRQQPADYDASISEFRGDVVDIRRQLSHMAIRQEYMVQYLVAIGVAIPTHDGQPFQAPPPPVFSPRAPADDEDDVANEDDADEEEEEDIDSDADNDDMDDD